MGTPIKYRKLREYLNSLPVPKQVEYAAACGTSIGYLRKVLYTGQPLGGLLCRFIDDESGGAVPRSELRPDIWPAPVVTFKTDKRKRIKDGCL